jgi:D-alanyl-D-alanine carboxypeptidase/D-alanyl-D-alanine-endopeptidase (penicillin-binding protein 4)
MNRWPLVKCAAVGVAGLAVILAAGAAAPAPAAALEPDKGHKVGSLLDARVHDRRIGQDVGALVIDATTGAVVWAAEPRRRMQPASNMKLVTAVNAIARIGPATRFPTTVRQGQGPRHLILQAGGDPLLSMTDLRTLATRTADSLPAGARIVLHVDDSLFPAPKRAPGWVDGYIGSSVGMVQALTLRSDRSSHPSRRAAEAFAAALRARGVVVRLGPQQVAAADAPVVASFRGHSVEQAVAAMLSNSDSSIAEMLFRQVAIASGRPPTWQGSRRAARETLAGLGIDTSDVVLVDGSGLSRRDRVTPRLVVDVLRLAKIVDTERFTPIFRPDALPIAGRTGTLSRSYGRYSSSPSRCATGRVQAKTGTILGTIALSGIAHSRWGDRIFSIIVNDRPSGYSALSARRAVDGLAATIVGCWR